MLNALATLPGSSIAELTSDELDMIGGAGTVTMVMTIECKIDDGGNGSCTVTHTEKPD